MTRIVYKSGDLLAADEMVIGHGCNAQGVMGAGIAAAIKQTYPGAYHAYRDQHQVKGLKVGDVIVWASPSRVVLNMVTQEFFGRDKNRVYVDYPGIGRAMEFVEKMAQQHLSDKRGAFHASPHLALPKIGAGLANGDWDQIAGIIEDEIRSIDVTVYVWP